MKAKVVPEPSERRTTVIACDGSFTLGLSLRSAAWFHDLISPRKILARVTVQGEVAGLDAFDIHHGHDAADDGRELHQTMQFQVRAIERHVGGAERHLLVPWICLMPSLDPTGR